MRSWSMSVCKSAIKKIPTLHVGIRMKMHSGVLAFIFYALRLDPILATVYTITCSAPIGSNVQVTSPVGDTVERMVFFLVHEIGS